MIIRSDDFDFRMLFEHYRDVHQRFIDSGLIETAVIQLAQHGRVTDFDKKRHIVEYLKNAPNWDIQFHCWSHDQYSKKTEDEIYHDLAASMYLLKKVFDVVPTVWYTPWNEKTDAMEKIGGYFGLRIDNDAIGIKDFVKQGGSTREKPVNAVYFHSWNRDEMKYFDEMIKLAKTNEDR